ncbi:MAG: GNAT family N-acetyltransferase [Saprospiraceae bacterium]|nr:GNAT family N-acetyltransferase [Saprospiraceae bacterium]
MTASIIYRDYREADFDALFPMSQKLWKDIPADELKKLLQHTVAQTKYRVFMALNPSMAPVGFAIFSLRTDYVEGAVQSPTGYLEGIFVEDEYRRAGIARTFLGMGEQWCRENGCVQMGSDTWISDQSSRLFHRKVGFREEEEVVHFLKDIS